MNALLAYLTEHCCEGAACEVSTTPPAAPAEGPAMNLADSLNLGCMCRTLNASRVARRSWKPTRSWPG
jgi:hypothetical protein